MRHETNQHPKQFHGTLNEPAGAAAEAEKHVKTDDGRGVSKLNWRSRFEQVCMRSAGILQTSRPKRHSQYKNTKLQLRSMIAFAAEDPEDAFVHGILQQILDKLNAA